MIIAAAQTVPKKRNIEENIKDHCRLITLAAENQVQLIVFPELSLTGYERDLAAQQRFVADDTRIAPLVELAAQKSMIVIAGAPIFIEAKLYIGAFILYPDGSIAMYTKQYLHEGEEAFFTPSFNYNPQIQLENETFNLAICADTANPQHPKAAALAGCSIYLASVFNSPKGMNEANSFLASYAHTYKMNVLMANYGGPSWICDAGGKSAFWTSDGEKSLALDDSGEGLLIAEKVDVNWRLKKIMS